MARAKQKTDDREIVRQAAEADLRTFIKLVAPQRVLGAVHEELCRWWQRDDAKDNQLILLPRDHQKSALVAFRVAWWVTKHPEVTILYASATADLAEKQLKFIKDIFTSDAYRYYWPEMVNQSENKRERWTSEEIAVDHPARKAEGVRDPTIKAVGITSNTTGLHCNVAVLDDVVVPGNAYTDQGRADVRAFYSQLSSIETTGAREWVVGTRYHPADLYKDLMDMTEEFENADGDWVEELVYEVFERAVETDGQFLWPRTRRADGKQFGFDERELARKKAKYLDVVQFYSQYYNNPNYISSEGFDRSRFQYYDRAHLIQRDGHWYLGDRFLAVYAAIDFAYSTSVRADYTALVTIGVDDENRRYVLDAERWRTSKTSVTFERLAACYRKWHFRQLRAEANTAQQLIVSSIRDMMKDSGTYFAIDPYKPPTNTSKEERIMLTLEPLYSANMVWHYQGGNCQLLEDEIINPKPEHDDLKDALHMACGVAKAPAGRRARRANSNVIYSPRFGGVSY